MGLAWISYSVAPERLKMFMFSWAILILVGMSSDNIENPDVRLKISRPVGARELILACNNLTIGEISC